MTLTTGRLATGTIRATTGVFSQQKTIITPLLISQIPEGKITSTIYSLIRDKRFQNVIKILKNESASNKSRQTLSLLGYCYFQVQEYNDACDW